MAGGQARRHQRRVARHTAFLQRVHAEAAESRRCCRRRAGGARRPGGRPGIALVAAPCRNARSPDRCCDGNKHRGRLRRLRTRAGGGCVMTMNTVGRPTSVEAAAGAQVQTISGDRGLDHEEPLLFELGRNGVAGVDIPQADVSNARLNGLRRKQSAGPPGLSEPEVVRHYVRLSRMNYAIDSGLYPLGSCTMKHNPRLNEKMARLPGFGDLHPLQPQQTVQGALALIGDLMRWLTTLTGMPAVAMSPKAGAHGALCRLLTIR